MNHSIDFIQDCFLVFDKVGDNKIALSQVGDLSRALGLNPTNKDISRVTPKNADPNQARITLDQFMPIYHDLEKVKTGTASYSLTRVITNEVIHCNEKLGQMGKLSMNLFLAQICRFVGFASHHLNSAFIGTISNTRSTTSVLLLCLTQKCDNTSLSIEFKTFQNTKLK